MVRGTSDASLLCRTGRRRHSSAEGADRALLLRGIFKATVRTRPEEGADLQGKIAAAEQSLADSLRRITRQEFEQGARHAVLPLFAAVVGPRARTDR